MTRIAFLASCAISGIALLFAPLISTTITSGAKLIPVLVPTMIALPFFCLINCSCFAAQGFNKPLAQAFLFRAALNLVLCVIIGLLLVQGYSLDAQQVGYVFLFASLITLGIAYVILRRIRDSLNTISANGVAPPSTRKILAISLPLLGTILVGISVNALDVIILSSRAEPAQVSYYVAAQRIAMAQAIVLSAISTVFAPLIVRAYSQGGAAASWKILRRAMQACVMLSLVIFGAIIFFTPLLLSLFGAEFVRNAGPILFVLAAGQCFNMATGPVGTALFMTGGEWVALKIGIFCIAAFLLLSTILTIGTPAFSQGIAVAITLVMLNTLYIAAVWHRWRRELAIDRGAAS